MKKLFIALCSAVVLQGQAQTLSNASTQVAYEKTNNTITFNLSDEGKATPIEWGMDAQWINEGNLRRGINFSSKEIIDILRLGFMPSANVSSGNLSTDQLNHIEERANLALNWCKKDVKINIGSDPAEGRGVDGWYNDGGVSSLTRGERWAKCIDLHRREYEEEYGLNVVSVSPFNEPDYGWNQGLESSRMEDFKNTARALREKYNGAYGADGIHICGCNTLNNDNAWNWWNHCRQYLDEGNTHQLAGGFDSYANFFKDVRNAGQRGVADELHNVMEAMVGVEYGMQTGIWWGTALRTRGQFMKATHGNDGGARLAYKENRGAWTAASVYRLPDGTVNAFVGTSERQCQPDNYRFVSLDRDVYYNGQGPMREFVVSVPGGYGYQDGQTNAETVIDITSGEDVQPYIEGTYKIVNVNSGMILNVSSASASGWTQITQRKNTTATSAQWIVTPVPNTIGEDFAYYHIQLASNTDLHWDIMNWNIDPKGKVGTYPGGGGGHIEQWYFEYAGNNNFYIRSRFNNLVVEMPNSSTTVGANIQTNEFTGAANQQWRLVPVEISPKFKAVNAPTNLIATPQTASVRLDWTASEGEDVRDYFIVRSEEGKDDFNTIARYITGTTFTDNSAEEGKTYVYAVKAEDTSLNRSERSEMVVAGVSGEKGLVCKLDFEENTYDATENGNHMALCGEEKYSVQSQVGKKSFYFIDAKKYGELPPTVANHDQMTISFWFRRSGASSTTWERVFDFGNGTEQYLFFTPNCGDNTMRFEMKNGLALEKIEYKNSPSGWNHYVISIDAINGKSAMYINGEVVGRKDITIKPTEIRPVMNYIGRSQFDNDSLIKGYLDDFCIYNYAMNDEEVANMYTEYTGIEPVDYSESGNNGYYYDIQGRRVNDDTKGVIINNGKKTLKK